MASADTLCFLTPQDAIVPASGGAEADTRAGAANHIVRVIDFDDTTNESVDFNCFMPYSYAGGGVTVSINWMATTATTGTCRWLVDFKSMSDDVDDIDTASYAGANGGNDVTASVSGESVTRTITFTDGADMDSVAAGEGFYLRISREADDASDTLVGDAELVWVEIKET